MPKVTGPLMSLEARKSLAKALTYQRRPGGASVYGYKKPKVPLTLLQQYQRQTIAAAVRAWQYAHTDLKAEFEEKAEGRGQSGYSLWMHERSIKCGGSVLYLPLVECEGNIAHDVSGYKNHSSIIGATWVKLANGIWYLYVDGSDDFVNTNFTFQSTFRDSFTIAIWAKPDDGRPAATKEFGGSKNVLSEDEARLFLRTTGKLNFSYRTNAHYADILSANAVFTDGPQNWHNIVGVADSTIKGVGGLKVYFDGDDVSAPGGGDTSAQTFADFAITDNFYIGALNWGGVLSNKIAGGINIPRIYARALSATEIQNNYKWEKTVMEG